MNEPKIEPVTLVDEPWLKEVWLTAKHILGPPTSLWRALRSSTPNEFFVGIRPDAFAHFRRRRDGVNVLYEIGVHPRAKKQGLGRALLHYIGPPMVLKTDADNEESNAFYLRCGFRLVGQYRTKKLFNEWLWEKSL